MQLTPILALVGLAMAAPNPARVPSPRPGKQINSTILTPDVVHNNVLKHMHPNSIIHSDNLHNYLKDNHGANHTIYVNDTRKFIHMALVKPVQGKRQGSGVNTCFGYTNNWAEQVQHWYDSWHPVSGCQYNYLDSEAASQTISYSYSLSISESAGLSWNVIADILSVTAGITVTETWSETSTHSCPIPAFSVGQIWLQNLLVWGWMWGEGCLSCAFGGGCGGQFGYNPTALGGAEAPADAHFGTGVNYGCSTGQNNVQC